MSRSPANREERILTHRGRRHYRRSYSVREVGAGAVIGLGLLLITAWVAWRGGNQDPTLFGTGAELLEAGGPPADRGPLPMDLAPDGWTEGRVASFDADTLYEKINGREGYYKAFGFERLHAVTLERDGDPERVIDIETYDLGRPENALGAMAGEVPEGGRPTLGNGGASHLGPNALLLARDRYYVRAIGPDDSDVIRAALTALEKRLMDGIEGSDLPWSYALFVGALGLDPSTVSYVSENAFSFGFASDVHVARDPEDDTERFVVRRDSAEAAAEMAGRFTQGFLQYGETEGDGDGVSWVRDRYLGAYSGVLAKDRWVVGIKGAPELEEAKAALDALSGAVASLDVDAAEPSTGTEPTPDAVSDVEPTYEPEPEDDAEPDYDAEPAYDTEQ